MGNTVSIPEEVIEAAVNAVGFRHEDDAVMLRYELGVAAPIIAAWAREQALDEAVAALEALVRPAVTLGRLAQNHGVWDALAAIAALKQEGV